MGSYIDSDKKLIENLKQSIENINDTKYKVKYGIIASGDIFCTDIKNMFKI